MLNKTPQHVGQMKLPSVPVKGWIIGIDIHGLLDGPSNVVRLHTHNGEAFHPGMVTFGTGFVLNREPLDVP